jgi:hypothetical protein
VRWQVGVLWMEDDDRQVLCCADIWFAPGRKITKFEKITRTMTFKPGTGLPGRVWVTQKPASIFGV